MVHTMLTIDPYGFFKGNASQTRSTDQKHLMHVEDVLAVDILSIFTQILKKCDT